VQAESLLIDRARSHAGFSLRALLVKRIDGTFSGVEGTVTRDPASGRVGVDVRIDANSVAMDRESYADWARSDDFFAAAAHPWIQFRAENIPERLLRDGGESQGLLTLRGITRPVRLVIEAAACPRPGVDCSVRASGEVKRSEFGMDARRVVLGDKVELQFSVRLHPANDTPAEPS
jgi:polyisoprenoid-binding protein YceI